MANTDNYETIRAGDFTINDIDRLDPLVVNNTHTIDNVFGGLNKIIKAIIKKLKKTDDTLSGYRGVWQVPSFTVSPGRTVTKYKRLSELTYTHAMVTHENMEGRNELSSDNSHHVRIWYLSTDWCIWKEKKNINGSLVTFKWSLVNEDASYNIHDCTELKLECSVSNSDPETTIPTQDIYYDLF